jgi:histidine ammonia-lyase
MTTLTLQPGELTLAQLRQVSREPVKIAFADGIEATMKASTDTVAEVLDQGRVVYGINTGFGLLANTRIELDDLETLQRSIVLSHAAGIGEFMDDATAAIRVFVLASSKRWQH